MENVGVGAEGLAAGFGLGFVPAVFGRLFLAVCFATLGFETGFFLATGFGWVCVGVDTRGCDATLVVGVGADATGFGFGLVATGAASGVGAGGEAAVAAAAPAAKAAHERKTATTDLSPEVICRRFYVGRPERTGNRYPNGWRKTYPDAAASPIDVG